MLTGLADAVWTAEHDAVLEHFAQDPSEVILTIYIDPYMGLKLDLGMPVQVGTPLPDSEAACQGAEGRAYLSSWSLSSWTGGLLSLMVCQEPGLAVGYRGEMKWVLVLVISWSSGEDGHVHNIDCVMMPWAGLYRSLMGATERASRRLAGPRQQR